MTPTRTHPIGGTPMPYTVHTPDGQAHTYPDTATLIVEDDVRVYNNAEIAPGPYPTQLTPAPIAVYPAGQWTHYHVEPAPYETDAQASEDTDEAQRWTKIQPDAIEAAHDRWKATYQQHLNAGRKAAEAQ